MLLKKRTWIIGCLLLLFALTFYNCSHTRPYLREDVSDNPPAVVADSLIRTRVLLIGDAGTPLRREPVLRELRQWSLKLPGKTTTIFLGDNLYPAGLPPHNDSLARPEAERRLMAQVNAVKGTGARGIFIPGNHDWGYSGAAGRATLLRQFRFITAVLGSDSSFLPLNGELGPAVLDLPGTRIIIIDTHQWIYAHRVPMVDPPEVVRDSLMTALGELLASAGDRKVLVLGHHPIATHGPHGGFFDWKDHLFPLTRVHRNMWVPLPVIGSLYPLIRWNFLGSNQEINGRYYSRMIDRLHETFAAHPPLLYAAGHDHNLQVFEGDESVEYILVSGSGSEVKKSSVGHGDKTLFAHLHTGFMVIDVLNDQRVLLQVVEPTAKGSAVVFQHWLTGLPTAMLK